MSETHKFITTERSHLVEIAQALTKGIPVSALNDPENRLTFRIDGSHKSGKSIITDTGYNTLFNTKASTFRSGPLSFSTEAYKGTEIMVGFVNGDYNWYKRKLEGNDAKSKGGIEFLQNIEPWTSSIFHLETPSIHIWIESTEKKRGCAEPSKLANQPDTIQEKYNALAAQHSWARYVELTINDDRLLNFPEFKQHVEHALNNSEEILVLE